MTYSFKYKTWVSSGIIFLAILAMTLPSCSSESEGSEEVAVTEVENPRSVNEIKAKNPKVAVGNLGKKTVNQKIKCTGMIDLPPTELVFVHSRTAGFVSVLKCIPGDYVKKGSLLAVIENSKLIEAQRQLMETKAELVYAESDFERKRQLKAENATSEKSYQEAMAHRNRLQATYNGLKSELSLLGINIKKLEEEGRYQSSISVYASKSGYVHSVDVNQGQMIQPSDKLMEIANNGHMHLELNVLSKDAPYVKIGQKVQFLLPSGGDALEAEVVKINPLINPETNTMNVHCHVENKKALGIKPGVFANATIKGDPHEQLGLPLGACVKQGGGYFAFRVVDDQLKKEILKNVKITNGWVTFTNNPEGQWVTEGAYYLDIQE